MASDPRQVWGDAAERAGLSRLSGFRADDDDLLKRVRLTEALLGPTRAGGAMGAGGMGAPMMMPPMMGGGAGTAGGAAPGGAVQGVTASGGGGGLQAAGNGLGAAPLGTARAVPNEPSAASGGPSGGGGSVGGGGGTALGEGPSAAGGGLSPTGTSAAGEVEGATLAEASRSVPETVAVAQPGTPASTPSSAPVADGFSADPDHIRRLAEGWTRISDAVAGMAVPDFTAATALQDAAHDNWTLLQERLTHWRSGATAAFTEIASSLEMSASTYYAAEDEGTVTIRKGMES